ncbi:MAG: hypothetical protein CL858_28160 [Cupriavidus sp.]|uniref:Uncharacterized protein n=1 Tax=Methylobacterium brachiatum TaxID=269660 RepID=A0AAJ1TRF9_9HYPH|nr:MULTISPECIES: hypothetical protein [Methylobacterium]MBU69260.1 hypothetical protein [Cupriavidus sp.]EIZ84862.1 hypothetical protein WYO_2546 [Methylobacterium sp. GXF4]MBP31611.1 hypothetical protein [Methylobacterium sp.]MCB4804552.1 hypothetical protein [Methylobacterium brachiatum]MDQ0545585.1 hypothetical protein [Methylobacterium brachiatum]
MRTSRVLAAALLLISCTAAAAACQCTGCGCKGGPGFRGPNGRCVSYKQLDKVCGSPPTSKCVFERHKQECEHEGAMPDEKGMERYRRSIETITH